MSEEVKLTQLPQQNIELRDSMNYPIDIHITPKAIQIMKEACKEENKTHLRIGVKGGGCSGFMYNLECIDATDTDQEDDLMMWQGSFCIVIDVFSTQYLKGTVIDYKSSLQETGFKFENPSAKRTCGCGSSFSA